ncbi:hypothetical protein [Wolbachia endosymbiont (group A) of Beris morrisii]|uniref:hypothetical protein n=1 Tax=Wolbachia endosymbiont (group A) of Beris morrisii TaxID=3066139 RepID=UPI003342DD7E
MQVSMMRKQGNWDQAKQLRQLVQGMPSKDSCDPNYRLCAAVTNKVMFVRSFIEDEGRSFEIGFQEQPP